MLCFKKFYRIQIICADVSRILAEITMLGVDIYDVECVDPITVEIGIQSKHIHKVTNLLSKQMISWKICSKIGSLWKAEKLFKRPVLLFGCLLFLMAAVIVQNYVFFVEVTGNQNVSTNEILINAEKAGIKFCTKSAEIRSEAVKNAFLQNMPQLQWAGITTRGCVAVIEVKERSIKEKEEEKTGQVSNIVAACDGIITEQTIYEGSPLFQIGDAVKAGDTLVSGYVDCGIKIRAGQSNAEIYALTTHRNQFISPLPSVTRGHLIQEHTCYKLRIGKKVINLCNHSGIIDESCVRMYLEDYWSFPGGFQLPVALICVTHLCYDTTQPPSADTHPQWLSQFSRKYLLDQMISGEILNEVTRMENTDGARILTGIYSCHEMIGREKYEGIFD